MVRMSLNACFRLVGIVLLILPAAAVQAQEMPDLIGSWSGKYRAAVYDDGVFEIGEETTTLVIEKQDGEFFVGAAVWEMNEEYKGTSDIGEKPATGGREAFIGLIGIDGKEITMAEVEDTGIYRGQLLDNDRLLLTYIEADVGDAVLLRAVFTRQR